MDKVEATTAIVVAVIEKGIIQGAKTTDLVVELYQRVFQTIKECGD